MRKFDLMPGQNPTPDVVQAIAILAMDLKAKRDHAARLVAKYEAMLADLASYSEASPFQVSQVTATGAASIQPVLMLAAAKGERPSTSQVIMDALRKQPGLTFHALCLVVVPKIESTARDKRKLVHSTLDYLKKQGKVYRTGDDRLYLTLPKEGA